MDWQRVHDEDLLRSQGTESVFSESVSTPKPENHISRIASCHSCGSTSIKLNPGRGPHAASLDCIECGGQRWISQKHADRIREHLKSIAR
jgi:hypothetical protein